jgi:hypothetical protein
MNTKYSFEYNDNSIVLFSLLSSYPINKFAYTVLRTFGPHFPAGGLGGVHGQQGDTVTGVRSIQVLNEATI